jgi:hypothetical protein
MDRILVCLVSAVLIFGQSTAWPNDSAAAADSPIAVDMDAEIAKAKSAISVFAASLQAELKAAMQAGGPVRAISVCSTTAIPITQSVAAEQGLQLSRVSLKNRNPANRPNDWQREVLESFEQRKAAGEQVAELTWSDVRDVGGQPQFRFMKAIPTAGLCLQCHGKSLAPEVSARLEELYPEDKARGFEQGDIRGAFVVTRQVTD